jgi:hypothetical protein
MNNPTDKKARFLCVELNSNTGKYYIHVLLDSRGNGRITTTTNYDILLLYFV